MYDVDCGGKPKTVNFMKTGLPQLVFSRLEKYIYIHIYFPRYATNFNEVFLKFILDRLLRTQRSQDKVKNPVYLKRKILRFCLSAFGLPSSSLCTNSKFVDGVVLSIILYVSWQMLPDIFNLLVHLSFCVIKLFRFLNQSLLPFSKSNCLLMSPVFNWNIYPDYFILILE